MNADGISYLDIGDAYMRGDLDAAINSVWSPMYSWILGAVMALIRPSMYWEFGLVQVVNFGIYVAAFLCFEFFWRQVVDYQAKAETESGRPALPEWATWSIGYLLFTVASLQLIELWAVTPDLLTSAFVYVAAGLIVRSRIRGISFSRYALLGAVLGVAYLSKSVMFPMAFVFLGAAAFASGSFRRSFAPTVVALLTFLIVAAPFVVAISMKKGSFTFGDAGKITYARYLNDLPYPHWQGGPVESGRPLHPTRVVLEEPAIYEFATPISGTYPVSYDPWYWYEGVEIRIRPQKQLGYVLYSVWFYLTLLLREFGPLTLGALLLASRFGLMTGTWSQFLKRWGVGLVALAGLGLYATVHVIGRYIGAFMVLLWADVLANLRGGRSDEARSTTKSISLAVVIVMLAIVGTFNLEGILRLAGQGDPHVEGSLNEAPRPAATEVVTALREHGVGTGDQVAIIGDAFTANWARLAEVKIVAQMLPWDASILWFGEDTIQKQALEAFSSTGARAVVAEYVPSLAQTTGWHRVGASSFFVYVFAPRPDRASVPEAVRRPSDEAPG